MAAPGDDEVQIKVKVVVGPYTFNIPCGKGEQNMKWLACVVAQRYRLMSKANGRARQREAKKTPAGFFVPCSVVNRTGKTVYPSVKVKDAVLDGSTSVKVGLRTSEATEEDGSAAQTTWAALAFNFSDAGRRRAEKLRAADLAVAEAKEAITLRKAEEEEQKRMDEMGKLLAIDIDSPAEVEAAMKQNWPYIRLERVTTSASEQGKLKRLLLTHYVGLSDLYKHYSGSSSGGSVASMSNLEFQHVLLVCKILDIGKEKKLIDTLFVNANADRNSDPNDDASSLTLFEFFETLLVLGLNRFTIDRSTGDRLSPSQAFKRLLHNHLLPRIAQMAAGRVRMAMQTPLLTKYFSQRIESLRRVYVHYSSLASDQGLRDNRDTVNLMEFCQLLQDAGFLRQQLSNTHSGGSSADLSLTTAREVFAGVQRGEGNDDDIENPMQELVFSEYLEAIARIGFERFVGGGKDVDQEAVINGIKKAIDAVVKLDPEGGTMKPALTGLFDSPRTAPARRTAGRGAGAGTYTRSFITEGVMPE